MRASAGFTLVELLVVIVVVGISLSIAIPGFQQMTERNRVATEVNNFIIAVNMARSEAMRRGSEVSIQSIDDGATNNNEFGAAGYCVQVGEPTHASFSDTCQFASGSFNDSNNNGRCDDAPADDNAGKSLPGCVLQLFSALPSGDRVDSAENIATITFGGLGELTATATRNVDVCIEGQDGRRVHIALVGRPKSHRIDDTDTTKRPNC